MTWLSIRIPYLAQCGREREEINQDYVEMQDDHAVHRNGRPQERSKTGRNERPLSKCVMTVLPSGAKSVWGEVIHAKWVLETMNMDYVEKAHGVN